MTTAHEIREYETTLEARRESRPRAIARPSVRLTAPATEPNPWAVACPSCGAIAHVECVGAVSPNAVHAWRMVDAMADGFRIASEVRS